MKNAMKDQNFLAYVKVDIEVAVRKWIRNQNRNIVEKIKKSTERLENGVAICQYQIRIYANVN